MKKLSILLVMCILMTVVCLTGCVQKNNEKTLEQQASAVFTLDVNPGVRVYIDDDNTVLKLEATNEDGEEIVAEIDFENVDYEAVVEKIIDKMADEGYLDNENNSVLVSIEKKEIEISEKLNEKINKAFEKHEKNVSIIEQELDKLDRDIKASIEEISKEHNISKGKAHLIEKIREEKPELSEEELAGLRVEELGVMLEDTSAHIKEQFKKFEKPVLDELINKEEALTLAVESIEASLEDISLEKVRITRKDGKMTYEVELVFNEMEYEILIDAVNGEILETELEEFEKIDPDAIIDDFCNKHNIKKDDFKGFFKDFIDGGIADFIEKEELLTKGQILKLVMDELDISENALKRTKIEIHQSEDGAVYEVTIENEAGDSYEIVIEAYTGIIVKAELNGEEIDVTINTGEAE